MKLIVYGMNYSPELTGIGRYTGELARGLESGGCEVSVVTTAPHYPGWFARPPYSAARYTRERDGVGISVTRCPVLLHRAGKGIWRLLAPLSFALSSAPVIVYQILTRRPDAILCIEPTLFCAPLALMAAKFVRARTVLHIQDLEIDAAFAVGHLKSGGLVARLAYWFERSVVRHFDRIVTISNQMASRLYEKGLNLPAERISIIRNWVDTSRIFPLDRPSRYRQELGFKDGEFIVLYAGQIGPKQALHVVVEAAEKMVGDANIRFLIAGEGPLKQSFVDRCRALPNIQFLGLQPDDRFNEFLNLADCHILPQDPAVKDLVLPSKLGGMLASGKPIALIADSESELANFLGHSCARLEPKQVGELPQLLRRLASGAMPDAREERLRLARQLEFTNALAAFLVVLESAGSETAKALVAKHSL